MKAKREAWLDGLKGFAILLVILGHVLSGSLDANTFPDAYYSLYGLRSWIYSFHMPLFFLLSGFTFTLAYYQGGTLQRRRYFRQVWNLLWIYVLFALLLWGVKQVVPELVNETYTIEDLKGMFLTPLGNFWYLYVLLALYLVAALVQLPRWNSMWLLLLGGCAIVVADVHMDWTQLTLYRIIYHLFFFGVGCMLCKNRKLLSNPHIVGAFLMGLAVAWYFYGFYYVRSWYANWKLTIALGTCWVYLYCFYRFPRLSGLRLFQVCGKYCLELYLLHTFFTAGLRTLLPMLGITTPWLSVWLNFLFSAGVSLILAALAGKTWVMDIVFRPARFFSHIKAKK